MNIKKYKCIETISSIVEEGNVYDVVHLYGITYKVGENTYIDRQILEKYFVPIEIKLEGSKDISSIDKMKENTNKIVSTYTAKNKDYGDSFAESLDEEGIVAARVRMRDKWNRFVQLSKNNNPEVKDESLEDTLLDLATYAIMTKMWLDKQLK